jgi:hypothetical protein
MCYSAQDFQSSDFELDIRTSVSGPIPLFWAIWASFKQKLGKYKTIDA